jgi:maleylacetoacetate isomerase
MKLYSRWRNSAGERVRIALNLKGIAYDYIPLASLPPGEYRRINPQQLIPTLEVDGNFLYQLAAILAYLEETYPRPALLPADPFLRAQALGFGAYVAAEMHAVTVNRVQQFLEKEMAVDAAGFDRWTRHWMSTGLTALEAILARRATDSPFRFGEAPGWADLHLVPQLANARRFNCDVSPYATLLAVEANCVGLDAFKRARPEAQLDFPGSAA